MGATHKYQVKSLGGLLRKVAIDYLRYGYTRYAVRTIPAHKNAEHIDEKILRAYNVTFCRTTRLRRAKQGNANVVYIRFHHRFILLATEGTHDAFNAIDSLDFRSKPLLIDGYTIGIKGGTPCVMIAPRRYKMIRSHLQAIALFNEARVTEYLRNISPFSFPGIVRQKRRLLCEVNRKRKRAGLSTIKIEVRFTKKDAGAPKIAAHEA
ncbi:hypothetical protein [Calothrix sp. NIES-2098]|uniref:hypothetical protein n=1 Tax=Calothrix sp. NIES-2098 TaxID=1954171 RepID=UPI000B6176DB|nr:hypothetical protein NIES2098_13050 [Calothrix sp. NIES-2098]